MPHYWDFPCKLQLFHSYYPHWWCCSVSHLREPNFSVYSLFLKQFMGEYSMHFGKTAHNLICLEIKSRTWVHSLLSHSNISASRVSGRPSDLRCQTHNQATDISVNSSSKIPASYSLPSNSSVTLIILQLDSSGHLLFDLPVTSPSTPLHSQPSFRHEHGYSQFLNLQSFSNS